MIPRARSTFHSFLAAGCIIVTPFLAACALVVLGIAVYRLFATGPKGEAAGVSSALSILGPAWPLLTATVLLGLVGFYAWRKRGPNDQPQQLGVEASADDKK